MRKILTAILVLVLSISAFAEIITQYSTSANTLKGSTRDMLYDQASDPSTDPVIISQNYVDPINDDFDCHAADDFVIPTGETWSIDEVLIIGGYWDGTGPVVGADIFFYEDNSGMPGDVIAVYENSSFSEDNGHVTATLSSPVELTEGTYWLGYAGILELAVGGQCGWQLSNGPHGNEFYFINPAGGYGIGTDWVTSVTLWPTAINRDLCFAISGTSGNNIDPNSNTVSSFELNQNYPNPFNPSTSISFALENNSNVQLAVFDAKGALVANLVNGNVNSGTHKVEFNASNLSTGVYYYTLKVNGISETKKMMLLK